MTHSDNEPKILIVYGTTEGHTRHICQFLEHVLSENGSSVTIVDAAIQPAAPDAYDICFIAGSLHVGNFQPAVVEYVRRYHEALNAMPTVFLSVSLSAAGENPDDWEGLDQCVRRFLHSTAWQPTLVHHVAGAISYSQYDFFKRLALQFIAKKRGQRTMMSRDYDLTDYDELRTFSLAFVRDHQHSQAQSGGRLG